MGVANMSFETPYVEYLVVGTHTSIWIAILIMAILGVPPESLLNINAGVVVLLVPIAYLLGTLFSTLSARLLRRFQRNIADSIFPNENYKDETLAYLSPDLFSAYTVQMHRVRLMGPSIFNWLFLAMALFLYVGLSNPSIYIPALAVPTLLSVLSAISWRQLMGRALEFRKIAIDVIREESKSTIPPKQQKRNPRAMVKGR
jgi:hypothetical protein